MPDSVKTGQCDFKYGIATRQCKNGDSVTTYVVMQGTVILSMVIQDNLQWGSVATSMVILDSLTIRQCGS